jgi:hypothetical protein
MTYLIVSEGVTAIIASIIPAPRPARRLRGALTLPLMPRSTREPIDRDDGVDDKSEKGSRLYPRVTV